MHISLTISAIMFTALGAAVPSGATAKDSVGCKTGTRAQNIAIAKNFYAAYNAGNAELLGKTLAPDFVSEPLAPGEPTGAQAAVQRMKFVRATFAPMKIENVDFIAEGNKVVVRSNITATHSGSFVGVAPTGKPLRFGAIDIHTICDGKIVFGQHEEGWMAVMAQIGVIPVRK